MSSALLFLFAPVSLSVVAPVFGAQDLDSGPSPSRAPVGIPTSDAGPRELGGALVDSHDPPFSTLGLGGPNTVLYQLNLPHRRWKEEFAVVWPDAALFAPPYPVLTLFHGFGETPLGVVNNTELDDVAADRGWLTVIPLGAHIYNYGIDYAQDNVEDVFEHVQQLVAIDLDRIYAVGFSMGGGAAASYAARHLDPQHVRFAAVVNHTGSTSLRDTYNVGGVQGIFESPLMFGGAPANAPYRYLRSSAIDLKPGNIVDPETDMVRNLVHVPVFHFSASNDPLQYLVTQSYQMHLRLQYWGGTSDWNTVPSSSHSWTTLATTILDQLQPLSLEEPREGRPIPVLADRDGRWHFFELRQARDKRLSPFTFEWSSSLNRLSLSDVENVASLAVEVTGPSVGLSTTATLQVDVQTRVLAPIEVVLRGYAARPSIVERNSQGTLDWSYDAGTRSVTLRETFGVFGARWTVIP